MFALGDGERGDQVLQTNEDESRLEIVAPASRRTVASEE